MATPNRRKRFNASEILVHCMSDDDDFDDSDDRHSDYRPSSSDSDDMDALDLNDSEPMVQIPVVLVPDAIEPAGDVNPAGSDVSNSPQQRVDSSPTWIPVDNYYQPPTDIQFTSASGITAQACFSSDTHPLDLFKTFVTDEVVELMVTETNRYAEQTISVAQLKPKSRMHRWESTEASEMRKFLGLLFLMGVVDKPTIEDYWSTDPLIATPLVNTVMSRNRFELLLKFWHFSNNDNAPDGDRLFKLSQICDLLLNRFQTVYLPEKQVSIDESMVLWRGRLLFRQYIPNKKHKYGVKLYMLCDKTGYTWNIIVYSGKMDPISGMGHSETVVMKLMEKRLDVGHELYVDNFYTGVPLTKELLKRKTLLCGTLRKGRKHLPKQVVTHKLNKGEVISHRSGQIVVTKWKDKRDVMILSTHHTGKLTAGSGSNRRGEEILKPDSVLDYNLYMGGIDRTDQLTSYYSPLRKSLKWYRKIVLHFFDIALTNSYLLYKTLGGIKPQIWFRLQVIRGLLGQTSRGSASPFYSHISFVHHKALDMSRLSGQHYFGVLEPTEKKQAPTKRCIVCHKKGIRRETRYFCKTCMSKASLCVVPCFEDYHTKAEL